MNERCGCCEGVAIITPVSLENRPGLDALAYRVGTHAAFLETMKARLTSLEIELDVADAEGKPLRIRPLDRLKTRNLDDPAIALCDAWALVADVLTFYQERIANEGYLRTATERRSILELAYLIGYTLKPGVAASVYLAFTIEPTFKDPVPIPAGTGAQSVPGPGETMQTFETSLPLLARADWNNLGVRQTRPQRITPDNAAILDTLWLQGTETKLNPNEPLLIVFGPAPGEQVLRRVATVEPDFTADRTKVTLQVVSEKALLVQALYFLKSLLQIARRYLKTRPPHADLLALRAAVALAVTGDDSSAVDRIVAELQSLSDSENLGNGDLVREAIDLIRSLVGDLPALWRVAEQEEKASHFVTSAWLEGLGTALKTLLLGLTDPLLARVFADQGAGDDPLKPIRDLKDFAPLTVLESFASLIQPISRPPAAQVANSQRLSRDLRQVLSPESDLAIQALTAIQPVLASISDLYTAWQNAPVSPPVEAQVYALRVTASLFGSTAPRKTLKIERDTGVILQTGEWPIIEQSVAAEHNPSLSHEQDSTIDLEGIYDKIVPESWVIVDSRTVEKSRFFQSGDIRILLPVMAKVRRVQAPVSRADYGVSAKVTRIDLADPAATSKSIAWGLFQEIAHQGANQDQAQIDADYKIIRQTLVYAQSELLRLAEEPIPDPVCNGEIELESPYDGLDSGRWIIVSGERADITDAIGTPVSGVQASELAMIARVRQTADPTLPGDRTHSLLTLATPLAYCYKRETLVIYGNVAAATHGETRKETLGSGDGTARQQFTLKQPPLTYVSAPTSSGVASTLNVMVNNVRWHETDALFDLTPTDRRFVTKTDDAGATTVVFGDGQRGARPPTGIENIKATYRSGIGKPGNVKPGQISLLSSKPLGVKDVTNPLRSSGGADKESRDQARRNAPLAVTALDRLVSTQDYADFARRYAGIGKAAAIPFSDGRRRYIRLTIAGEDDIPIDVNSDLYRNLRQSLHDFGDPAQEVRIVLRERSALLLCARVSVLADYLWEDVEPRLRAALLTTFSFVERDLGQSVFLSEILATMQPIPGVDYVEVDLFDSLSEADVSDPLTLKQRLDALRASEGTGAQTAVRLVSTEGAPLEKTQTQPRDVVEVSPTQLAYFVPELPDTLILKLIETVTNKETRS